MLLTTLKSLSMRDHPAYLHHVEIYQDHVTIFQGGILE